MDEKAEKEFERMNDLSYDEMVAEGIIILPQNPDWRPMKNPIKISGRKTATEVLLEMRAEERY
jgi:hypothetical protein